MSQKNRTQHRKVWTFAVGVAAASLRLPPASYFGLQAALHLVFCMRHKDADFTTGPGGGWKGCLVEGGVRGGEAPLHKCKIYAKDQTVRAMKIWSKLKAGRLSVRIIQRGEKWQVREEGQGVRTGEGKRERARKKESRESTTQRFERAAEQCDS